MKCETEEKSLLSFIIVMLQSLLTLVSGHTKIVVKEFDEKLSVFCYQKYDTPFSLGSYNLFSYIHLYINTYSGL